VYSKVLSEALLVGFEIGERGRRGSGTEQHTEALALVDPEGGDVDERDDVRSILAERGDDLATVGVAGDDGRPVLTGEDLSQPGDIGLGRSLRELRRGDLVALALQVPGDGVPA
jgi:hypothetical protein